MLGCFRGGGRREGGGREKRGREEGKGGRREDKIFWILPVNSAACGMASHRGTSRVEGSGCGSPRSRGALACGPRARGPRAGCLGSACDPQPRDKSRVGSGSSPTPLPPGCAPVISQINESQRQEGWSALEGKGGGPEPRGSAASPPPPCRLPAGRHGLLLECVAGEGSQRKRPPPPSRPAPSCPAPSCPPRQSRSPSRSCSRTGEPVPGCHGAAQPPGGRLIRVTQAAATFLLRTP